MKMISLLESASLLKANRPLEDGIAITCGGIKPQWERKSITREIEKLGISMMTSKAMGTLSDPMIASEYC